jgi:hypothetical protein
MAKQYLGMGDYHFLKLRGVERRLHLVMIAHTFLTHLALDELDAQDNQYPDTTSWNTTNTSSTAGETTLRYA